MGLHFLDSKEDLSKELIGGKGFYLHQMAQDNLPVPQACFISTQLWQEYKKSPSRTKTKLKKEIIPQIISYLKEKNDGCLPLFSVRSAGAVSMPGMMDTILNVGVNQKFLTQYLDNSESEKFAADIYSRFLTMYGQTVLGIDKDNFTSQSFDKLSQVEVVYEDIYKSAGFNMPSQKVEEQLFDCIVAVFDSWNNERAVLYRKLNNIDENAGTAVVIQQMVFGNKNENSATGVLFSRNPSNGKDQLSGEYLINAQGEDVVSGSHTPQNLSTLADEFEDIYNQLKKIAKDLELKYKQIQDIEFTIEDNKLYILQARTAKTSPFAKLVALMDMYKHKDISAQDVLDNLSLREYMDLNIKQVDPAFARPADGEGIPASMGALSGRVVFGPSVKYKGEPTILLAKETTPDDLEAIQLSDGILTASGGATSHAAVVARGMGKVCVVGCSDLKIVNKNGDLKATIQDKEIKSGDWITIDANTGKVWTGKDIPIIDAQNMEIFWDLEDLVLEARPQWTRVTSKVDELIRGRKTYYLTYPLDEADEDFVKEEFTDAVKYLTGVMDLTGKMDYYLTKYPDNFLFSELSAQDTFLRKKKILTETILDNCAYDQNFDFEVFLGPYEEEHGPDIKRLGLKICSSKKISFNKKQKDASLIITQDVDESIPDDKLAISAKNALLGILK